MAEGKFSATMTIAQAMAIHPRVAEVFAAFHLAACPHCHVAQVETLEEVCASYGVDSAELIEALEGLFEPSNA